MKNSLSEKVEKIIVSKKMYITTVLCNFTVSSQQQNFVTSFSLERKLQIVLILFWSFKNVDNCCISSAL